MVMTEELPGAEPLLPLAESVAEAKFVHETTVNKYIERKRKINMGFRNANTGCKETCAALEGLGDRKLLKAVEDADREGSLKERLLNQFCPLFKYL